MLNNIEWLALGVAFTLLAVVVALRMGRLQIEATSKQKAAAMNHLKMHLWGIAVLLVVSILFLFRYEIIPAGIRRGKRVAAFRLDRWTGDKQLIDYDSYHPADEKPPAQ